MVRRRWKDGHLWLSVKVASPDSKARHGIPGLTAVPGHKPYTNNEGCLQPIMFTARACLYPSTVMAVQFEDAAIKQTPRLPPAGAAAEIWTGPDRPPPPPSCLLRAAAGFRR